MTCRFNVSGLVLVGAAGGDQPFITGLAYEHEQIRNPEQAAEFHALARTIAGQTADPRTEIEVFRHYYAQIRAEKNAPACR